MESILFTQSPESYDEKRELWGMDIVGWLNASRVISASLVTLERRQP